jgi:hypothetical protein
MLVANEFANEKKGNLNKTVCSARQKCSGFTLDIKIKKTILEHEKHYYCPSQDGAIIVKTSYNA